MTAETTPMIRKLGVLLMAMVAALAAHPAGAQMAPIQDLRELVARAEIDGNEDLAVAIPPAPFAPLVGDVDAYVKGDPEPGHYAHGFAFMASQFFPAGIYFSGHTTGDLVGPGLYSTRSVACFIVRLDQTVDFTFDGTVIPSLDPSASGWVKIERHGGGVVYFQLDSGSVEVNLRLSPGFYTIEGLSVGGGSEEFYQGATYEMILLCELSQHPLIGTQPAHATVGVGGNAVFSVVPSNPRASLSFQWRKGGEPLVDGGRISGATTSTLTIHQVAHADSGYYDVVLTEGDITEYSSVATLTVTGAPQGIDAVPIGEVAILTLGEGAPNPFRASTTFRYVAPAATPASMAIYDATGRMVRPLLEQVLSGPGMVTWDGKTASGTPAPAGIYFFRLVPSSGQEQVRRIALVR